MRYRKQFVLFNGVEKSVENNNQVWFGTYIGSLKPRHQVPVGHVRMGSDLVNLIHLLPSNGFIKSYQLAILGSLHSSRKHFSFCP